jgi:multidrug/hemolysin transport system permease protein
VLIIIALYVTFLGNTAVEGILEEIKTSKKDADAAICSLILSGMISMSAVTTCLGALSVFVNDKIKAAKDFYTTPISRGKITLSYIFSSTISGLILTFLCLIICVMFIFIKGGIMPDFGNWLLLIFSTVFSVICGNAMVFFLITFINSVGAFAPLSTILGTMLGFIMGIYMPIGILPSGIQLIIKIFPMSHSASMFRQILADDNLERIFQNAPPAALEEFRELYGVTFHFGSYETNFTISTIYLVAVTILFYGLSILKNRKLR